MVKDAAARRTAMEQMRRLVTPVEGNDLEANPIAAFEMEFRRTVARIRYYDEVLATLDPDNLAWGMTKETEMGSGEHPGTDIEHSAAPNVYYELQFRERKHLMDMVKVWIGAKLDVRKLEVEEQKVDALNNVMRAVLIKLGHDPNDPEVRRTVRDSMLALPVAGAAVGVKVSAEGLVNSGRSLVEIAAKEARARK